MAAEVPTRASNAMVVINFRMMGLPSWSPLNDLVARKSDRKVRQASRFHDREKEPAYRSR
jgi:hypothetical protein